MNKYLSMENQQWLEIIWNKLDAKLSKVTLRAKNKLPYSTTNGVYDDKAETETDWWTNGVWGGLNWLMYVGTSKDIYLDTAIASENMLKLNFDKAHVLHHDVGFMFHLTAGLHYKIIKDENSFNTNYIATMALMNRFNLKGSYIRAWNDKCAATWSIIDCLMNLPLLYWASEELEDDRFVQIAKAHADMAMEQHIRENGTIKHIVVHDEKTGEYVKNLAGQGYSETSCWSRGAAWAIYGFALAYTYTKDKKYLDTAIKVAKYFISAIEKTNYLPLTDFLAPEEPIKYDSTAGCCATCGLIEIAKHVSGEEKEFFIENALKLLKAIEGTWCDWNEEVDGIVQMGMEAYHSTNNKYLIYGDFFFTEAILKFKNKDFLAW